MAWEPVKLTGSRGKAKLSLRKNGQIGFNSTFQERFLNVSHTHACVFFDPETRRIGIQLTGGATTDNATEIMRRPRNTYISATAVFNRYGINSETDIAEPVEMDEKTGYLVAAIRPRTPDEVGAKDDEGAREDEG